MKIQVVRYMRLAEHVAPILTVVQEEEKFLQNVSDSSAIYIASYTIRLETSSTLPLQISNVTFYKVLGKITRRLTNWMAHNILTCSINH
jgi:hypothetical protein